MITEINVVEYSNAIEDNVSRLYYYGYYFNKPLRAVLATVSDLSITIW
jgi:hypothetical protein